MKAVSFTRMQDGTREDYALLQRLEGEYNRGLADRVLTALRELAQVRVGYQVDRLEHSLQTATRALRDGADEELVVCALVHDIGDNLAPENHSRYAAEILRPYVSEANTWLVEKHGIFQGYFFWHHLDADRNEREKYRGHPWFDRTAYFCEHWDQTAFDPAYDSLSLEHFEPMLRRIFAREPWSTG